MTSRIRVAQIGFGYWGPNILRAVASHPGVDIVTVCDTSEKQLLQAKRAFPSAETSTDIEKTVTRPDVDAIIVALPAALHFGATTKALAAGKHCFVEKPLALTTADCLKLIELADAKRRVLMVGHTYEYHGAVQQIKGLIDKGEIGQVFNIFAQRMNLGRIREDVDAMWNLAPHDISIALYWLDHVDPITVRAQGFSHLPRPQPLADLALLTLEFPNGVVAHIVSSWLSPEKIRKIMLVGSKKMVTYDDVNLEAMVQIHDKGIDFGTTPTTSYGEYQALVRTGDLLIPALRLTEPLRVEMHHFVECITEQKSPISDGRQGLRVTRILELASQSMANNGMPVPFK